MWHNHEYRHQLRDSAHAQHILERPISHDEWAELYEHIHQAILNAGLKDDGFSKKHLHIINKTIKEWKVIPSASRLNIVED